MKKEFSLLVLLLLLSFFSIGQDVDGYYIKKTGDTIRGKIKLPMLPKLKLGASSQIVFDPLEAEAAKEAKEIDYAKLTFDVRFSSGGEKYEKIDRLKVKGFGFSYQARQYDFISWDVTANKQIYLIPATGDVAPDGVYFILRSIEGVWPVYSLFQEVEMSRKSWNNSGGPSSPAINKSYDGNALKRDVVFEHPTKGLLYISDQYPLLMKQAQVVEFLQLEQTFLQTLKSKETMLEIVKKYNVWAANYR
ncbi:hypothetical protein [Phnomibacter sp. MR]|uniref:hypothetical protein n=1 Tax=Phnomibacter sp. MR TaxID=3042318 RepID=UPI003A804712